MSKTLDIFFIYAIIFRQEKEVMYLYLIIYKIEIHFYYTWRYLTWLRQTYQYYIYEK